MLTSVPSHTEVILRQNRCQHNLVHKQMGHPVSVHRFVVYTIFVDGQVLCGHTPDVAAGVPEVHRGSVQADGASASEHVLHHRHRRAALLSLPKVHE